MEINSRRVISNTLVQFFYRGLVVLISLGTTRYLTRRLGVVGYADFGFFTALVTLFYSLADWGTQLVMIRDGAQIKQLHEYWWNALWSRLGLVVVGYGVYLVFLFVGFQNDSLRLPYVWGGLILFFFSLKTTAQAVFQIRLRHDLSALLELVAGLCFFLILMVVQPAGFFQVVIFLFLAAGLTAGLGLVMAWRFCPPGLRLEMTQVSRLIKKSGTMGLVMIVYSLLGRVSIFFLKLSADELSLGYYVLAQKVYDNLILGAAYLMNVLYPMVAFLDTKKENRERLEKMLRVGYTSLGLMALSIFAVGVFFSRPLIFFLGGESFGPARFFLHGLLTVLVISYFNHLSGYTLVALGKQKRYLGIGLVGLTTSLTAHFLFLQWVGPIGVIPATVVAETVIFIISYNYLKKLGYRIRFRPGETIGYLVKNGRKET